MNVSDHLHKLRENYPGLIPEPFQNSAITGGDYANCYKPEDEGDMSLVDGVDVTDYDEVRDHLADLVQITAEEFKKGLD